MEKSSGGNYQLECPLAHDLLNKLSVIVGHYDLLEEETPGNSALQKRMLLIRSIAKAMAAELGHLQCDLVSSRKTKGKKVSSG